VGPAAPLAPGLEAVFRYVVTRADTAAAVGSGEAPVLVLERIEGRRWARRLRPGRRRRAHHLMGR
jgi:hypothetical protein